MFIRLHQPRREQDVSCKGWPSLSLVHFCTPGVNTGQLAIRWILVKWTDEFTMETCPARSQSWPRVCLAPVLPFRWNHKSHYWLVALLSALKRWYIVHWHTSQKCSGKVPWDKQSLDLGTELYCLHPRMPYIVTIIIPGIFALVTKLNSKATKITERRILSSIFWIFSMRLF